MNKVGLRAPKFFLLTLFLSIFFGQSHLSFADETIDGQITVYSNAANNPLTVDLHATILTSSPPASSPVDIPTSAPWILISLIALIAFLGVWRLKDIRYIAGLFLILSGSFFATIHTTEVYSGDGGLKVTPSPTNDTNLGNINFTVPNNGQSDALTPFSINNFGNDVIIIHGVFCSDNFVCNGLPGGGGLTRICYAQCVGPLAPGESCECGVGVVIGNDNPPLPLPPILSSTQPNLISANKATNLRAIGQYFKPETVLDIDGVAVGQQFLSPKNLSTTVPANLAIESSIQLTASDYVGVSNPVAIAVGPEEPPIFELDSVSPNRFPADGQSRVINLVGTEFTAGTTMTINGSPSNVTFIDATHLRFTTTMGMQNALGD